MKKTDEGIPPGYIDVRGDGRVVLYRRMHLKLPKWQARISVRGAPGYDVKSTGTADFDEAKRWALNRFDELSVRVLAGHSLRTPTFRQVYDDWVRHAGGPGSGRHASSKPETAARIASYALEFFGPKRIDAIKEGDFVEYWAWRGERYDRKCPSPATLKRERTGILSVFKHALTKGHILTVPKAHLATVKGGRRPTFTRPEWRQVELAATAWLAEGKSLATERDRFMALHFFMILAHTGLRTGELQALRWCDIERVKSTANPQASFVRGTARGKTGTRQFIFNHGADVSLKKVYNRRRKEVMADADREGEDAPPREELIFCHKDGTAIRDYGKSLKSLLEFAGVPIVADGKARSPYSLRHYYATRKLEKGLSPFLLAQHMGTSVEMLEQHYGHVRTEAMAAQIGGIGVEIPVASVVDFPF